ncbi:MAG TPA: PAC2 family protein [Candidatus Nanoarchaeia archaeon]|nr:PAC2 family protein [Candidatus Nanoarchaeia archaeon]
MNSNWMIKNFAKVIVKEPIVIEGLPGMGNVGKIAVDFIIEALEATKIYELNSDSFPNCVFLSENGLVELPKIEIYHKKINKNDFLLISGDVQPSEEKSCYEFCENLLDLFQKLKVKEIVTLGGIGLNELPKEIKLYCAGNNTKTINKYLDAQVKSAEGVVGPIVGVSGLLLGLAQNRNINGVILLVETLGLPSYLGIKEAKELLNVLNRKLKLNLNIQELNKEVKAIEKEINDKLKSIIKKEEIKSGKKEFTNYIG